MIDLHLKSKALMNALMDLKAGCHPSDSHLVAKLSDSLDDYTKSLTRELQSINDALEERCAENLRYRKQVLAYWKLESAQLAEIERLNLRIVELGGKQ